MELIFMIILGELTRVLTWRQWLWRHSVVCSFLPTSDTPPPSSVTVIWYPIIAAGASVVNICHFWGGGGDLKGENLPSGGSRPSGKGGRGGGVGAGLPQFFFRPFGPQFGQKVRGAGPPGPSPSSATASHRPSRSPWQNFVLIIPRKRKKRM